MQQHLRTRGFTLIELMIAIAVLAILLTIGVPTFTTIIRNNRAAAHTNEFSAALALARSEASKRGLPVSACPANAAQTACSGATNWSTGWLIFVDPMGAGTLAVDNSELVIQRANPLTTGVTLNSTSADTFIRFGANGAPTNVAPGAEIGFILRNTDCAGTQLRRISINQMGRVGVRKEACP